MARITVLCSKCGQPVEVCRDNNLCQDLPEHEHPGFLWNRMGEECMRWLRYWGIIR